MPPRRNAMYRFALPFLIAMALAPAVLGQAAGAPPSTATFLTSVAAGNLFEIDSSKVALSRTKSDAVKAFANQMVADHTAAGVKFKQAVAEAKLISPPEKLDAKHQATLDGLKARDGASFDKAYIDAQYNAHVETLDLFKAYAKGGDNAR